MAISITRVNSLTPAATLLGTDVAVVGQANTLVRSTLNALSAFLWTNPTLTGTPSAPTADPDVNSTQIATTEFVKSLLPSVGSGTWASRPTASGKTGKIYFATDIGVGPGAHFISDGTDWVPMYPITLYRGATKISIPNNTLTTFQTYLTLPSLPGGLMGTKNALYAEVYITFTGSTNGKTMRFNWGGSTAIQTGSSVAANVSFRASTLIRNRNATNSQISQGVLTAGGFVAANVAPSLYSIDTTAAATMVFSGQTAVAGEVLDLEWYEVRLQA